MTILVEATTGEFDFLQVLEACFSSRRRNDNISRGNYWGV